MKKTNLKVKMLVAATVAVSTLIAPITGSIAEATTLKATSNVNMRASSTVYSSKVGYVQSGTVAKYLGMSNGWYKISVNGKVGYTASKYWKGSTVNATSNVNLRSRASGTSTKLAYIAKGTEVKVLGRNGTWLYLEYNGKKGYASKYYWNVPSTLFYSLPYVGSSTSASSSVPTVIRTAAVEATSTVGSRVVAEARKLLGARYVYGGNSWSDGGFDCSGLTQYVYSKVGISIPRTVTTQYYGISRKISASNRKPGDIIIFSKSTGMYHAGIYIGDNKMIHSPEPGKTVSIKSLDWYQSLGRIKIYLRPYGG